MPRMLVDEAVVARIFAPCGPGLWEALRTVSRFVGGGKSATKKLDELERMAIGYQAL